MKKLMALCVLSLLVSCAKKVEPASEPPSPPPEPTAPAEPLLITPASVAIAPDDPPRTKWFLISRAPDSTVTHCWRVTVENFEFSGHSAVWEQPLHGRMRRILVTGSLSFIWVNDGSSEMEQDAGNALGINARQCDYGKYPATEK